MNNYNYLKWRLHTRKISHKLQNKAWMRELEGRISRKNWLLISFSKIYIDYKRWKASANRKIVSVTEYPNGVHRAYIESKTKIGYLVWISKKKYKDTLHLQYTCDCTHFKIKMMPQVRDKYTLVKTNGDFAILIEDWHNLDKHAYVAANKLFELKIPVALPVEQLIDFSLIDAGRYKKRFQKEGISTLLELANLPETSEMDPKLKEFKERAKMLFEDVDLIEIKKDVFVTVDKKLELLQ